MSIRQAFALTHRAAATSTPPPPTTTTTTPTPILTTHYSPQF